MIATFITTSKKDKKKKEGIDVFTLKEISIAITGSMIWMAILFLSVADQEPSFVYPKPINISTRAVSENPLSTTPRRFSNIDFILVLNFVLLTLIIITLILLVFIIKKSNFIFRKGGIKRKRKQKSLKEKIIDLNLARKQARVRLLRGIEEREYTQTIIEAYQLLDKGLQGFRKMARPKYMTPKEYAFTVFEPVYQNAVRGIVEIFYRIQYGMQQGKRSQVKDFLFFLDHIFVHDVKSTHTQEQVQTRVKNYVTDFSETFIPHGIDFTKPFRRSSNEDTRYKE